MTKKKPTGTVRKYIKQPISGLARLRKKAGLALDDLAKDIGSERSTVYRWETGLRMPEPRYWLAYAAALGVTIGQLGQHVFEARRL